MRRSRLDGLHAAAIAAGVSLALTFLSIVGVAGLSVFKAPLLDIALQAIVQGLLTAIVALLLYGRMVSLLWATGGTAFVALTPVMTGLMGIPVLGEPIATDWVAGQSGERPEPPKGRRILTRRTIEGHGEPRRSSMAGALRIQPVLRGPPWLSIVLRVESLLVEHPTTPVGRMFTRLPWTGLPLF
jgi:hypothetical protein